MSGPRTIYANLVDAEFLNGLDDHRKGSQVIEELCQRLERDAIRGSNIKLSAQRKKCPVCQTVLLIGYDTHVESFTIRLS